jgi:chemotaxis protein MotB
VARRKKHAGHENHERWLVSYADFITLLFAFFVVMFASSQTDKNKAQAVSNSVRQAIEGNHVAAAVASILGGTKEDTGKGSAQFRGPGGIKKAEPQTIKAGLIAELMPSMESLTKELGEEIKAGKVRVSLEPRGLVISLHQAAFFPSGEDAIAPATYPAIQKVANAIRKLPNPVRLEGHTDSIPISNSRFRSNWELSAARGIAMMEVLRGRFGVARERMAIAGYSDIAPVETNETEEGRRQNRRVDIIILNQLGAAAEPPVVSPSDQRETNSYKGPTPAAAVDHP